jgi:hypothetical protein
MARRIARLETETAQKPDLSEVSDEDLHARLVEILQKEIADPDTPEGERIYAARLLALPWDRELREWTREEQDVFFDAGDRARFGRGKTRYPTQSRQ